MILNVSCKKRKKQKGMTLLEVVISMLIIGMGLAMSIAMLQSSLRYQATADQQERAMLLMQEMIDMMRGNTVAANCYTFGDFDFDFDSWHKPAMKTSCAKKQDAKGLAAQRANADLTRWLTDIKTILPNGKAAVDVPDATNFPNQYRIQLQWLNREDTSRQVEAGTAPKTLPPVRMNILFTL